MILHTFLLTSAIVLIKASKQLTYGYNTVYGTRHLNYNVMNIVHHIENNSLDYAQPRDRKRKEALHRHKIMLCSSFFRVRASECILNV